MWRPFATRIIKRIRLTPITPIRMGKVATRLRQQLQRLKQVPNGLHLLKSEKGVALLIALFAMTLMTFIAVEVSYDTSVDYVVAAQQVNRVRAYYAAKSGIEISLLRIMLY